MLHPLYLLPLIALSVGCSRNGSPVVAAPGASGQSAIAVHDHLGWPYRLRGVQLTLDGAPVSGAAEGPQSVPALSAGEHTLAVDAEYTYASAGGDCDVRLRVTSAFQSGPGSEGIAVHLYRRDLTSDFDRGVDVALFVGRGQRAAVSPAEIARGNACAGEGSQSHDEDWTEAAQNAERRRRDFERITVARP